MRNFFSLFPFLLFPVINLNERKKICRTFELISSRNIIRSKSSFKIYWFFQRNSISPCRLTSNLQAIKRIVNSKNKKPNLLHLSYSYYCALFYLNLDPVNRLSSDSTRVSTKGKIITILPTRLNDKLKPQHECFHRDIFVDIPLVLRINNFHIHVVRHSFPSPLQRCYDNF